MYKSYSYNNMPRAITERQDLPPKKGTDPPPQKGPDPPRLQKQSESEEKQGIFDRLETDDIILMIVIAALLLDDCDDKLLIAALAFIFFSEYL